jgi:uncharacterized protein YkwD
LTLAQADEPAPHPSRSAPATPPADGPDAPIRLASRDADSSSLNPNSRRHQHSSSTPPRHAADPYGFAAYINSFRARAGLPPLAYDPNLSAWASHNNAACCKRGLGHHVFQFGVQNAGYNYASAYDAFIGWVNSPGHRANMLSPSIHSFGIAYGPGPYWTLNAR